MSWLRLLFFVFLLIVPTMLPVEAESERDTFATSQLEAISVWSNVTIGTATAYSKSLDPPRPAEDCLRPEEVQCFSIQQNIWISDSQGRFILWAQNSIQLAKLRSAVYYGTFTFLVWNASNANEPLMCQPLSFRTDSCRPPFYSDMVQFPASFHLYAHVSHESATYKLQMSNNFGSISWDFPASANCPCFIETVRRTQLPWGYSPLELVVVGLDNSATAIFGEGTAGTVGPVLIESPDGVWHETSMNTLHCISNGDCRKLPATAESSINLTWNNTLGAFYWSKGARDQGVYISSISQKPALAPMVPEPTPETYLYVELLQEIPDSVYLTIYDEQQRKLGYDAQLSKFVEDIPNTSVAFDSGEDLIILNPVGSYQVTISSALGGFTNTAYTIYLSKATNNGGVEAINRIKGTLAIVESIQFLLDTNSLIMRPEENTIVSLQLLIVSLGLLGVIISIFILRKKTGQEAHRGLEKKPVETRRDDTQHSVCL